jgi:hypothetical protein
MVFSVIVPIYKVEAYLPRCIESVLNQSFPDFELILVDDGSPDNCPAICDAYAAKDPRVRVIHKQNGGLVSARQAGIREALGTYVFNVDGDDALAPDALETAAAILREYDADMVSFAYRPVIDGVEGDPVLDLLDEGFYDKAALRERLYPKLLSDVTMHHIFFFLSGKAIKRTLLLPHQLNVNPAISLGEDLCCVVPCYLSAETVYMSHTSAYLYTIRGDSISTDFKTHQITQTEDVVRALHALTTETPPDFDDQIARHSVFMSFAILAAAAEGGHFKAMGTLKRLILHSELYNEIRRARFTHLTTKSRLTFVLMKHGALRTAFLFLYLCKLLKTFRKGGTI